MDPKYWSRNPGLESSKALELKLWNALSREEKLGWEFQSHQNPFPGNSHPIHGVFQRENASNRELRMRKRHISARGSQGPHPHPPYPKIGIVLTILLEFAEQDPLCPSPAAPVPLGGAGDSQIHARTSHDDYHWPRMSPLSLASFPGPSSRSKSHLGTSLARAAPKQHLPRNPGLSTRIIPPQKSNSMDGRPPGSRSLIPLHPTYPSKPKSKASPWIQPFSGAADPWKRNKEVQKQEMHPKGRFPAPGWIKSSSRICPQAQGGGEGLFIPFAWRILTKELQEWEIILEVWAGDKFPASPDPSGIFQTEKRSQHQRSQNVWPGGREGLSGATFPPPFPPLGIV